MYRSILTYTCIHIHTYTYTCIYKYIYISLGGHGCIGDFPGNADIKEAVEYVYGETKGKYIYIYISI
jgi:hypothetical protein